MARKTSRTSTNRLVRSLNAAFASSVPTTGRRQNRIASLFEPLESRTLMSVVHAPVLAAVHTQAKSSVLAIPSSLSAAVKGPTSVQLNWIGKDSSAAGYNVLRSGDGATFTQIGRTTSFKTCAFTDTTASSNSSYSYEVQAYNTNGASEISTVVNATTPLNAPASLAVAGVTTSTVQLSWTDKDSSAGGYYVLRSDNGKTFTQIANITSGNANSYTDNAMSGRSYKYEVQAYSGSNASAVSNAVTAITAMAAPSRLEAAALSSSSVQLVWADNDSSATGYYVLRSTDNVHYSQISKLTAAGATTYTDKTPLPRHTYFYEIQAFDAVTSSPASNMASASTPLAIPTAVSTIATAATIVRVNWADTDAAATGYYVLRAANGGTFMQIAVIGSAQTTTYTDATAASNTTYQYKVQAYCTGNTSALSDSSTVMTPLAIPTALTAAAQSGTSMVLNWTDNDSAAAGYLVFRAGGDGKTFVQLASLSAGNANTYTDATVHSGQAYQYEVQAIRTGNSSVVSAPASASTPLAAPSGLSATAQSSSTMQLNWTDNDSSATGYLVLRSGDGVNFSQVAKLTSGSAAAYTDSSLLSLHAYTYKVEATTAAVTSPASGAAAATTPLTVPTGLAATVKGPTSIQLGWTDKDPSALGYYVLRSGDGSTFTQIAQVNSGATTSYTDTTASNHSYVYKVRSFNGSASSDASNAASALTPLIAPSALNAAAPSGANVQLTWTDNDSSAAGYIVLRATDGVHFTQLAKINSGETSSYSDTTVVSGKIYQYEVQAFAGSNTSSTTSALVVTTPLAAPSGLSAAAATGSSVQLNWTDNDTSAAGYYVMRSTDGTRFSQVAKLTSATANSYTDSTVTSAQAYTYEVQAFDAATTSAVSDPATVTTALNAPTGLTVSAVGAWVNLSWTSKDAKATGFAVLRSSDGTTFTQLTKLNSISTTTYCDMTASSGQTYYYKVQAVTDTATSPASNVVNIVAPSGGSGGNITITTRYGNELVITASGTQDAVALSQSGSTLTISADGQTYTQSVPAAGVFIYARGGADGISIDGSVNIRTTVEAIDGAVTAITSAAANVSAWIDSADSFSGLGVVHAVSSFAGGVSKALGASLANPTDAGATTKVNQSLWGAGPVAADIGQGGVGDCYFLSSLAAFAGEKSSVVTEAAVDMGDGTYAVRFISQGTPVYVRVSNSFSTGYYGGGFQYAHPGPSGDIWAMVMEKAFAYFRTGANSYASINSGWMGSVYANLGVNSSNFFMSSYSSESAFYNMVSTDLANGDAVTLGTVNAPNLVSGHAYTLISASTDSNGVIHYVVRNPWGISGDSLENSQGYATLTFAQIKANFYDGCQAIG